MMVTLCPTVTLKALPVVEVHLRPEQGWPGPATALPLLSEKLSHLAPSPGAHRPSVNRIIGFSSVIGL